MHPISSETGQLKTALPVGTSQEGPDSSDNDTNRALKEIQPHYVLRVATRLLVFIASRMLVSNIRWI